jgi:hypothetical protein
MPLVGARSRLLRPASNRIQQGLPRYLQLPSGKNSLNTSQAMLRHPFRAQPGLGESCKWEMRGTFPEMTDSHRARTVGRAEFK